MKLELKLAWKYFRTGRTRLVRFTSFVAVAGIAIGLASFIVANALADGLEDGISANLFKATGHITIRPEGTVRASDALVKGRIGSVEGVDSVEATTFDPAAISLGGAQSYVLIRVVPDSLAEFASVSETEKDREEIPVVLGSRLITAEQGSELTGSNLFFGGPEGLESQPVRVAGTIETGIYEYDSTWIYVRESDYLLLMGLESFVPGAYIVRVSDPFESQEVAERIRKEMGPDFEVVDWQEANRPLFTALSLERRVALWIIALIVVVAMLNITTTLSLLVRERFSDIAVLRTLGADTRMLSAVFLLEGWILALSGIVLGCLLGLGFCVAANAFKWISLPPEVYSLSDVRLIPRLFIVAGASVVTFVVANAAMAIPVVKAANVKPLEILRRK